MGVIYPPPGGNYVRERFKFARAHPCACKFIYFLSPNPQMIPMRLIRVKVPIFWSSRSEVQMKLQRVVAHQADHRCPWVESRLRTLTPGEAVEVEDQLSQAQGRGRQHTQNGTPRCGLNCDAWCGRPHHNRPRRGPQTCP